jgi:pimeloyl-ACP methyl ester carboxylesterase
VIESFLLLALVLAVAGAFLCVAIAWLLARSLVTPPRMTDGKAVWVLKRLSPGDLGLEFEEVSFDLRDVATGKPLRIAAWWIPHPQSQGRCVILLHGYADAKVGSIAWAPTWHALGWNILAIDLRAHGESGGRHCTGGYFERHDVSDVINLLRAQRPTQTTRLALFGASFGSAVAVTTAAMREDVDAIVLDSPVPDFAEGAMLQMNLSGAPGGFIRRLAVKIAERLSGSRFAQVRLIDLLPKLNCPAMLILPEHDPLLEGHSLTPKSGVVWKVPNAAHLMALAADPDEYSRQIDEFLKTVPPA